MNAKNKVLIITETEFNELNKLKVAIHGLHELLDADGWQGSVKSGAVAAVLCPVDDQFWDLMEAMNNRFRRGVPGFDHVARFDDADGGGDA